MRRALTALLLACAALTAQAQPLISIIIDDIGDRYDYGRRALELPGALTYSILPHTPYAAHFARFAHQRGREVMLHLPMQAEAGNRLGPGGVTLDMTEQAFRDTVRANLAAVPYARGINNHMGSLLTRHPGHMDWLMSEMRAQGGLFFVDSVTTVRTVAAHVALEHGLPSTRRDVFLDSATDPDSIRRQFARLLAVAHQHGTALAIGHPYPGTLQVLAEVLPQLDMYGVRLVPVSQLIATRQERSPQLWRASLSPSPPAAKN
ncbi:MAG: divergent polysaccharide deacetylase family protein [Pseudomonadota bacterium]